MSNQQNNTNTQVAKIERPEDINPDAPVGSRGNLSGMLALYKARFADVLPKHLTAERMVKVALTAAMRTPKLLECSQGSIIESMMRAAELGLDPSGTLGYAYLVPFYNKKARRRDAQLIIGYRGLAMLAYQSGEVQRIEAEVVYSNDTFEHEKGTDFRLRFVPNYTGDRGQPVLVYALAEMKGGSIVSTVMTIQDVNAVRNKGNSAESDAWVNHWDEMAKKSAFRRLSKWIPLSTDRLNLAMQTHDEGYTYGANSEVIDEQRKQLDALNDELLPSGNTDEAINEETGEVINMAAAALPEADQPHGYFDDENDSNRPVEYETQVSTKPTNMPADQAEVVQPTDQNPTNAFPQHGGENPVYPIATATAKPALSKKPAEQAEQPAAAEEEAPIDPKIHYSDPDAFAVYLGQYWDIAVWIQVLSYILKKKVVSVQNEHIRIADRKRAFNVINRVFGRLSNADDPNYEVVRCFAWAMNSSTALHTTGDVGKVITGYRAAVQAMEAQAAEPADAQPPVQAEDETQAVHRAVKKTPLPYQQPQS